MKESCCSFNFVYCLVRSFCWHNNEEFLRFFSLNVFSSPRICYYLQRYEVNKESPIKEIEGIEAKENERVQIKRDFCFKGRFFAFGILIAFSSFRAKWKKNNKFYWKQHCRWVESEKNNKFVYRLPCPHIQKKQRVELNRKWWRDACWYGRKCVLLSKLMNDLKVGDWS